MLFIPLLLMACARRVPPPVLAGPGQMEQGLASWYGKEYHGRVTASGEIYNMFHLTAAHRTLPFRSQVEVVNLNNQRRVQVRINDRGPFIPDRIIDLSYEAAKRLGMVIAGVVPVQLRVLWQPVTDGRFVVQAGALPKEEEAIQLKEALNRRFSTASVIRQDGELGRLYRVQLGPFNTREEAEAVAIQLSKEGLPALVIRVE